MRIPPQEISKIKDLFNKAKSGGISKDLLKEFKELSICKQKPQFYNEDVDKRTTEFKTVAKGDFAKGRNKPYQKGQRPHKPREGGGEDMKLGGSKPHYKDREREREEVDPFKRAEAD